MNPFQRSLKCFMKNIKIINDFLRPKTVTLDILFENIPNIWSWSQFYWIIWLLFFLIIFRIRSFNIFWFVFLERFRFFIFRFYGFSFIIFCSCIFVCGRRFVSRSCRGSSICCSCSISRSRCISCGGGCCFFLKKWYLSFISLKKSEKNEEKTEKSESAQYSRFFNFFL